MTPLVTKNSREFSDEWTFITKQGQRKFYDQMYATEKALRVGVRRAPRPGSDHMPVSCERMAKAGALVQFQRTPTPPLWGWLPSKGGISDAWQTLGRVEATQHGRGPSEPRRGSK